MTTSTLSLQETKTPSWLKFTAGVGVIWYAFGLLQFWLGFSMDTAKAVEAGTITANHAAAISGTPLVVWISFAVASAAGVLGSIWLFNQSPKAKLFYTMSLVCGALYYLWVYGLSGSGQDRPSEELIIAAVVLTVTIAFNIISRRAN